MAPQTSRPQTTRADAANGTCFQRLGVELIAYSCAAVDILGETFDFIAWKDRFQSFYVRRCDGDLRVIELKGMREPLGRRDSLFNSDPVKISAAQTELLFPPLPFRFWCKFADGTSAPLTGCTSSAPSLVEREQLRKLLRTTSVSRRSRFTNDDRAVAVEAYRKQLEKHPKSKLRAASLAAEEVERKTGKMPDPKTVQNWYSSPGRRRHS